MPRIRVKEGDRESVHDLADGVLRVGRSPDNHVVLTDRECSRHHCHVERAELGFKMVDLESRNGTKANGRVMNQHLLKAGDVVSIGKAEMRYEDDGGADARVPARAASPADRGAKPAPRPPAATGRVERPRRTYARRGGDATKWVFLGVLLVGVGIAAFAISRFAAVDPELKQGRDLLVRAQAAERKADALTDPGDQAVQLEAALELYRQIPESAASPFAAARQKIPQLESLRRDKLDESRDRRLAEDMEAIDRYRDSRTPPDTLGAVARYQALLEKVPAGAPIRPLLEERIRALQPEKNGGSGKSPEPRSVEQN